MNKYILFCSQEANFQTRSMLIPYDKYLKSNDLIENFHILRKYSKPQIFCINGINYDIDNLLIQNIIWNNNLGIPKDNEYNSIVNKLTWYAFGVDSDQYFSHDDALWYEKSFINLCSGCDHIVNYCNLRNKTTHKGKPIEIIEGFLVLQARNGELN